MHGFSDSFIVSCTVCTRSSNTNTSSVLCRAVFFCLLLFLWFYMQQLFFANFQCEFVSVLLFPRLWILQLSFASLRREYFSLLAFLLSAHKAWKYFTNQRPFLWRNRSGIITVAQYTTLIVTLNTKVSHAHKHAHKIRFLKIKLWQFLC